MSHGAMTPADIHARLRHLQALSDGFKVELESILTTLWPSHPVEAIAYSMAIQEAQEAIERGRGAMQAVADKIEERRRHGSG
jgi:hypothetical protein